MPASTEILTETLWPLSDRSGTRALASIASVPPVALPVRKAFLKGVCSYFQAVVASNQPHNSTFREFFCTGQLGSIATAPGQPAQIGQPLASDLLPHQYKQFQGILHCNADRIRGFPSMTDHTKPFMGRLTRFAIFQGLRPFDRASVSKNLMAGFALAAMNVPQALGYTKIAGTPVITGLYTLLLPLVAFAAFGSSRYLVVAADSATAAILAGSLTGMAPIASARYIALAGIVALLT